MENGIAGSERSFYHSFPRNLPSEPPELVIAKGLEILKGIKSVGMVLAPEVVEWRIPQIDGTTKVIRNRQTRICFTELSRSELSGHAESFGPFSLQFPIQILRQFGILPVIYVPQMVEGDRLLSSFGPVIVWMFENARHTLDLLDQLSKLSDPQFALELARKTSPEATHVDPNYVLHLQNQNEDKTIVQRFEVKASIVRGMLDYLNYKTAPFDLMRGAIYAAQNLFYPTDDQFHDKLLSYYRQREWRIIPGATAEGNTNARMATSAESKRLTNTPVRRAGSVLKCPDDRKNRVVSAQAT
ncbi:MAG: hypothetical protein WB952_00810 [Terriglobales bacterium]